MAYESAWTDLGRNVYRGVLGVRLRSLGVPTANCGVLAGGGVRALAALALKFPDDEPERVVRGGGAPAASGCGGASAGPAGCGACFKWRWRW